MRIKVAAVLVSVAVLSACGGGDDDGEAAADPTTTTEAPTASADQHLLTLEDFASDDPLDAQWEEGDVKDGVPIELPECVDEESVADDGAAVRKFVTITDLRLPSVQQVATAHAAADEASEAFDAAVARLDGCTEPTFTYEGAPNVGTIAPLEMAAVGEESRAWRTTVTIAGTQVNITTIHIRDGAVETSLVHTDVAQPDEAAIAGLASKAAARLG